MVHNVTTDGPKKYWLKQKWSVIFSKNNELTHTNNWENFELLFCDSKILKWKWRGSFSYYGYDSQGYYGYF